MARKWINYDFGEGHPINQLFCGFEGCARGYNSAWQDWDYQFWCRWCPGNDFVSEVLWDLSFIHPLIWEEFSTLNGWEQMLFQ